MSADRGTTVSPSTGVGEVVCEDDRRRARVRSAGGSGIDAINVSVDQRRLGVIFFGQPPEGLCADNFRVEGGSRVTGIKVLAVAPCTVDCADAATDLETCVELTVDRPGDWSTYRLCVVEADPRGGPGAAPHPGLDPRYACLEFSFKQHCPTEVDCVPATDCPPPTYPEPPIDYLAKDYASFRQLLFDRLALTMPDWTDRHVPDIGVTLAELLAYVGDQLSYHQDAVATEAYLDTARRRVSVRRHVRLVDYPMHDGCAARTFVCVETTARVTLPAGDFRFVTLAPGVLPHSRAAVLESELAEAAVPPGSYEVFEPVLDVDVTLDPAHNHISLWTWGDHDCCLPTGATTATLRDEWADEQRCARQLRLASGDVIVFEEVRGPQTGHAADADPAHRQAVRLTSVVPKVDELYGQPVLEVAWEREDALTFPLCVNARGGPDCVDLEVGVARGNVILVEHGRSLTWCGGDPEPVAIPAAEPEAVDCRDSCCDSCAEEDPAPRPPRFTPALRYGPVTQRAPFPDPADVAYRQAAHLRGVPGRALARLKALAGKATQPLPDPDVAYLTLLFGAATLRRAGYPERPQWALRWLLVHFEELLAGKLRRIHQLVRRARAGYRLEHHDIGWELASTWGEAEGAAIDPERPAFHGPVALALRADPTAALPAVAASVPEGAPWTPRRDLIHSGPADRHVVGEVDDDGVMRLRFGDGRTGAAPPPGGTLAVRYRVGNGSGGNVGRGTINRVVCCATRVDGITQVRNPLAAVGGVDPEPVPEVRQRAPHEMRRRLLRAVTAEDYATLAARVTGVQRAAGDLRWTGSWYEAQVAIDPLGTTVAPEWLRDEVRESLHPYRRIGHDVAVTNARHVALRLALDVVVAPDHVAGHVAREIRRRLGTARLPDGRLGFFHPDNLTFGTPVRVSQIVAVAAAVPGVRHVAVTTLQRLFGEPGDALDTGILPMRPLEVPRLDDDPAQPENGLLTLCLRGGR